MRITTSKLKRVIRRVILESNTGRFYGEIQNEILALAQEQGGEIVVQDVVDYFSCLLYTSPSPRDATLSRMPSSA